MNRLISDGWFQLFAIGALLSLGLLIYDGSAGGHAILADNRISSLSTPVVPLAPSPPVPVVSAPPPAPISLAQMSASPPPIKSAIEDARIPSSETLVRAPTQSGPPERAVPQRAEPERVVPERAAPAPVQTSFPIYRIVPKKRGRWVVANLPGPDVDSPSIARVIFSAADGDEILLKPGLYQEPLLIWRKNLTLRGLGLRPEDVLLTSPDTLAVLKIDEASVKLENVRIEPEKGYSATAAAVLVRGRLTLRHVTARSRDVAILAAQSGERTTSIDADDSLFDGYYADLLVRGQARVELKNVRFTNPRQPIVVWRDSRVKIDSCRFRKTADSRMYAYMESSVAVANTPTAPAVSMRRSTKDAGEDARRFRFGRAAPSASWLRNNVQRP